MTPASQPELYVDGMLDVSFARGVVRVDLYSLSATERHANGQPKAEFRQRMVMSSSSFLEFVGGLQLAVQSLREKGALPASQPLTSVATNEPAAAPPPVPVPTAAPVQPARKGPPQSPNFPVPGGGKEA